MWAKEGSWCRQGSCKYLCATDCAALARCASPYGREGNPRSGPATPAEFAGWGCRSSCKSPTWSTIQLRWSSKCRRAHGLLPIPTESHCLSSCHKESQRSTRSTQVIPWSWGMRPCAFQWLCEFGPAYRFAWPYASAWWCASQSLFPKFQPDSSPDGSHWVRFGSRLQSWLRRRFGSDSDQGGSECSGWAPRKRRRRYRCHWAPSCRRRTSQAKRQKWS